MIEGIAHFEGARMGRQRFQRLTHVDIAAADEELIVPRMADRHLDAP